ncbi:MAG: deoxynucleoside kinase [Rickettsiales bacterium]|nr:deoxynucleoside kinase [Rickettsiales bacterium]
MSAHGKLFLGIAGLIGAGKTTLAKKLAKKLKVPVFEEPVADNEYLQDFYGNMREYGFQMQVWLLNKRFEQHQNTIWSKKGGVSDRTIYEDGIFAKTLLDGGFMDERDYRTYLETFDNMSTFMKAPDVIVYLHVTPEQSFERIQKRERGCESGITLEYLQALYDGYEAFVQNISKSIPVIRVPWGEFKDTDEVAEHILAEYNKMNMIVTVDFTSDPSETCESAQ